MSNKYLIYLEKRGKVYVKEDNHKWVPYNYAPEVFTLCKEDSPFKSIDGRNLVPLEFENIKSCRDRLKELGDAARSIYGFRKFGTTFVCQKGYEPADLSAYNVLYHDIETEVGQGFPDPRDVEQPINMITLIDRKNEIKSITTCAVRAAEIEEEFSTGEYAKYTCEVIIVETEEQLFRELLRMWKYFDPEIFVGFNSEGFDVPYIVNRMNKVLGEEAAKELSPFGNTFIRDYVNEFGQDVISATIEGVQHVDLLQSYKKFILEPRDSYSLDYLSQVDLGASKLKHESGIPGHLLYHKYPTDGLRYNIVDVIRLKEIDEKKGILALSVSVAQMAKSNIEDVIFSTRLWMNMIYAELREQGIFFQIEKERTDFRGIIGGYVKPPMKGLHEWIGSFDFASLYPSIIMALNMGVDTKAQMVQNVSPQRLLDREIRAPEGVSMGANGQCFTLEKQSFISVITDRLYKRRKEFKNLKIDYQKKVEAYKGTDSAEMGELKRLASMYGNYDLATKVLLNSLYGALCERNFYFYDPDIAESITLTGQFMVNNLGEKFVEVLEKNFGKHKWWVYSDTDSIYFSFTPIIESRCAGKTEDERINWLSKFCDGKLKEVVRLANDEGSSILNAYDPARFDADREVIGRRGVFVAKKMYAIAISDNEGVRYEKPKLKITGLAAKKASTPVFFRDEMQKFFELFLNGHTEDAIAYIGDVEERFKEQPLENIAANVNVKDINESKTDDDGMPNDKGVHINQRAFLTHNWLIAQDEKANREIEPLQPGDKVKMIKLRLPNITGQKVIAWNGEFPDYFREAGIAKAVDFKLSFEDNFRKKLNAIFKACEIDPEVNALDIF